MIDNMFSIKDASKLLDCSTQNIYRQKGELISKGFMEQSNTGAYFLNEKGINYLKEKRIETIKANQELKQVANQDFKSVANDTVAIDNTDLVCILKEQLKELKEEKEFWRNKFEQKDAELQAKNDYIQELNIKALALLDAGEQNKQEQIIQQEPKVKKSFLQKFFS